MTHILVVDPNEAFATLLDEELQRQGYETVATYSYEAALEAAGEQTFDLALLDMGLEEPGSLELARRIREVQPSLRLMLIPMMGEELAPDVTAGLAVQGILPKPFFLPELPERIEAALQAPLKKGATEKKTETSTKRKRKPNPEPVSVVKEPATDSVNTRWVTRNHNAIRRLMQGLAREVTADAVLLTVGDHLITWVGRLEQAEAEAISQAVLQGWLASAEVARILGREQVRFEQSIAGGEYLLYAIGVNANAILTVAVPGAVTLGMLRHRARGTAEEIAAFGPA